MSVRLKDPATGVIRDVPDVDVDAFVARGWAPPTATEAAVHESTPAPSDSLVDKGVAGVTSAASGLTLGGSDVLIDALATKGTRQYVAKTRADNPITSTVGGIVGGVAGAVAAPGSILARTPAAAAARLGARIGRGGEGAGVVSQIGRAATGGAAEGALQGAGQGVSELALSDDPLTLERAVAAIGSNVALGAAPGAFAGGVGKAAQLSLVRAKATLDKHASRSIVTGADGDLAALDVQGLRGVREAELESLIASQAKQKAEAVEELTRYRATVKEANPWLAIAEGEEASLLNKSNRALRNALDDPKGLKESPGTLLKPLRVQEQSLERAIANREAIALRLEGANTKIATNLSEELATLPDAAKHVELQGAAARRYGAFADVKVGKGSTVKVARADAESFLTALESGEVKGAGQASLGKLDGLLDANRQLQAKIKAATTPRAELTSPRLQAIADAKDALTAGRNQQGGIAEQMLGGTIYGHVAGLATGLPIIGPMIGAKAARTVTDAMFGRLGKASAEAAARGSKAVQALLDVSTKVAPAAPVIATKVLGSVAYAPPKKQRERDSRTARNASKKPSAQLAELYKARTEEIRSQITPGLNGQPVMRQEARARIANQLAPIRAVNLLLADGMEEIAARRLEFLADKIPRRPDVGGLQTGPDKWQPSDMEMRTFARYVAAAEDPYGVVERLASGSVTPEDAETLRTVYPEIFADIQHQIITQLPTLRATLPYQRRLSLSVFTGIPVDPTLDPRILRVLQASFANEEGTDGGIHAPKAEAKFGSVSKDLFDFEPTPAQSRSS